MFRFYYTNITSVRQTSTTKYNCFVSKKFFFIDGFFSVKLYKISAEKSFVSKFLGPRCLEFSILKMLLSWSIIASAMVLFRSMMHPVSA